MRGEKKAITQQKMDRQNILPFWITPAEKVLYDQDDYKYLIHLYRIFPTDEFHILQFLLLQFHPLILRVSAKYQQKGIALDWVDIVSFARYSFVELVHRFNLDSTLYFKTYIPLALDRALNDWMIYDIRRRDLLGASRLDSLPAATRDAVLESGMQDVNTDEMSEEVQAGWRAECLSFVDHHPDFLDSDRQLFRAHYLNGQQAAALAREHSLPTEVIKRRLSRVMQEVKQHLFEVM